MTSTSATVQGTLYIVATPIGNREDLSLRALHTLQSVDIILTEDTRHSLHFLTTYGIKKPLIAYHAHNEVQKQEDILARLLEGQSIALISDAGTPLISDPGYPLVASARAHQIRVVPIPGACALITALSAAGIPCDTFTFAGFLPAKQSARRQRLRDFFCTEHTLVFYESTHRIIESIEDVAEVFGASCELIIAKELTKTFEGFIPGSCETIRDWFLADAARTKGEFVILIPPRIVQKYNMDEQLLSVLLNELPLKQAVKIACQLTETPKNALYEIALQLK